MRKSSDAAKFFPRYLFVALLLLVAVPMWRGCSDPPDPILIQKLSTHAKAADRLIVVASGEYADPTFSNVEIKGPEKATQFLATVEFSSKRRFFHLPFRGEYQISLCFQ